MPNYLKMISVITPVYNGERFIEACIKSVIDQNCPEVEHIIMDGGSTDRTTEIIKHYAERHSHIRWVSEKDRGQSDAMNKGIALARGEILGILNVDDFYEPNVLDRVLKLFLPLPNPSLLVANCNVWNDEDTIIYVDKPTNLNFFDLLTFPFRQVTHPVNPSAYFYHTSLHQKIGPYKVDEHYAMDVDFILRAVQVAHVKYIDEIWGNYRLIVGTKTFNDNQGRQGRLRLLNLLSQYRKKLPVHQKIRMFAIEQSTKARWKTISLINKLRALNTLANKHFG
ncbi:glycosyltransferase family 2 protein [Pseudanabaena sp. PCC 6802]|uniref:glycosyltransferase family 2 protein n=1 Tax=Pseudanabaena sp. PCC 6802 TaxID=118173 RepID=UPI000347BB3F|nr:glycosyltransferase family 2 protein [Pseudanabaena sp. PCC 6802]